MYFKVAESQANGLKPSISSKDFFIANENKY